MLTLISALQRYLRVEGLPRYEREARSSKLDPYKHYIEERVKAAAPDWTQTFLRQVDAVWTDDEREAFVDFIARNPEAGDIIRDGGGSAKFGGVSCPPWKLSHQ